MRLQLCPVFVLLPDLQFFQEEKEMDIEAIVAMLDFTMDTKRKRHIVGGILLSVSMLFGGLALTAMTLSEKENDDE